MRREKLLVLAVLGTLTWASMPARAIIVLGGDATGRNLTAAPNGLDNYVGSFGGFLGTPISSQYFVTANHIGDGGSGGVFTYANGTGIVSTYNATPAGVQDDLAIWKINAGQSFSLYAPLFTGGNETGLSLVTIGRGLQRGAPLTSPNGNPAGWRWGANDGLLSWGTGTVGKVLSNLGPQGFGGDLLDFAFARQTDSNGNVTNPNQGIFAGGDSGGPTFVFNPADNQYELAGINSLVDTANNPPNPDGSAGAQVLGAIYDSRGFYNGTDVIPGADPVPFNSYVTSTESRMAFIDSIVVPEPASLALLVLAGAGTLFRRRPRSVVVARAASPC